jgi:two-component system chemotaxis response regulator CheY
MAKALVVDDSRVMRLFVADVLAGLGYSVFEAQDGEEALELLERDHSDVRLITVDRNMPRMNGLELVKHVRADQNFDKVMILMVTSEVDPMEVNEAMRVGANEYVRKPFKQEALRAKVESITRTPLNA